MAINIQPHAEFKGHPEAGSKIVAILLASFPSSGEEEREPGTQRLRMH